MAIPELTPFSAQRSNQQNVLELNQVSVTHVQGHHRNTVVHEVDLHVRQGDCFDAQSSR